MRSNFRKNLTYKVGPEPIVIRRVYFQGANLLLVSGRLPDGVCVDRWHLFGAKTWKSRANWKNIYI